MAIAYAMTWTEHERGWGQRPDGLSIHPDEASFHTYRKAHFERNHVPGGGVPDEYTAPDFEAPFEVEVCDAVLSKAASLDAQGRALWLGNREYSLDRHFGRTSSQNPIAEFSIDPAVLAKIEEEFLESLPQRPSSKTPSP